LTVVLIVWLIASVIFAACWLLNRPPVLREWLLTNFRPWFLDQWAGIGMIGFGVSVFAAFYLMLAIHELGHVAAGLCAGFRYRSLRVGPLLFNRPFRASIYRGPGALVNGDAELIPVATDKLAWRGVAMVLGGQGANILSAMIVLVLPFPITVFSAFFIACSIVNGVNDLFPFGSRLAVSDGRRIWMLLGQPQRGERWLALLYLGGQINDGVLPELLSADFLAKAIEVRDSSADPVVGTCSYGMSPAENFWKRSATASMQAAVVLGSWVGKHALIIGYRSALRFCAYLSGVGLMIAFFISRRKEFSVFDGNR
jgi:hypothetical protein